MSLAHCVENNDKFAIDRPLPELEQGDVIVIHDTGAHGPSPWALTTTANYVQQSSCYVKMGKCWKSGGQKQSMICLQPLILLHCLALKFESSCQYPFLFYIFKGKSNSWL